MNFAIEYYGVDHVLYGSDYPCWTPATALELLHEVVSNSNTRRVMNLT